MKNSVQKLTDYTTYLHRQLSHLATLFPWPYHHSRSKSCHLCATTLSEHSGRIQSAAAAAATLTPVMCTNGQTESEYRYMWGGPKNNKNFFLDRRGALLPPAPAWCVYVIARRISWPCGVLESSIRSAWFFPWVSCHCFHLFFNGRLKRMCLHQVLFPFGENSSRNCHNASRGF